jgi:hypothetical protein
MAMNTASGSLPIVPLKLLGSGSIGASLAMPIDFTKFKMVHILIYNIGGASAASVDLNGTVVSKILSANGNLHCTIAYDSTYGKYMAAWVSHTAAGGTDWESGGSENTIGTSIISLGGGNDMKCIVYAVAIM